MTPIVIELDDGLPDPPKVYTCNVCGTEGVWGEGWSWYGSYRAMDRGEPIVVCCSEHCRKKHTWVIGGDSKLVTP